MSFYYPNYPNQMMPMPGIPGKVVNSFQEITIGDIPTNGNVAFFIKNDLSEIQTRKWSDDGRVLVGSFKPETSNTIINTPSTIEAENEAKIDVVEALNKRFDSIEEKLDKITPKTRGKKEEEIA